MYKYYIDSVGKKYRFISLAKDIDNKQHVVLQELFGKGEYVILPLCFQGNEPFVGTNNNVLSPVKDENEALKNIPIILDPKYRFPDIDYNKETPQMSGSDSGVNGMKTLLKEKLKIVKEGFFNGLDTPEDIEKRILNLVRDYVPYNESILQDVFHLIQVWGGMSGRHIYVRGEKFDWRKIKDQYKLLVDACLNTKDTNNTSIDSLASTARNVSDKVDFLGISFVTKHTYFWLHKCLPNDALPIYDSIMALEIMRKTEVRGRDLADYWKVMVAKAQNLDISLKALERQIYLYSRNNK